jgi:hypothetical protein
MMQLPASCGNRSSAAPTTFWMRWRNTSRTPQADSKSSSRQVPFLGSPPDSSGLAPNTEGIGIAGQSGKWKDGCVRPCSNISKAHPKKYSCRRPLKARENGALARICLFQPHPARSKPSGVIVPGRLSRKGLSQQQYSLMRSKNETNLSN